MKLRRRFRYSLRKATKNRKKLKYEFGKKAIFDYSYKASPAFYYDLSKRNSIQKLSSKITRVRYADSNIIYYLGKGNYTGFFIGQEGLI